MTLYLWLISLINTHEDRPSDYTMRFFGRVQQGCTKRQRLQIMAIATP